MTDDGRRYVPEGGLQKLRSKIHKESKEADDQKGLPYTLGRPPVRKCYTGFECVECGYQMSGSKNTYMIVCPECKKLTKVKLIDE